MPLNAQRSQLSSPDARPRPAATNPWVTLAIIGITLLGAVLRFYHLGHESLWLDEMFSWTLSHQVSLLRSIARGALTETNPPGYLALLIYVQRCLGDSEVALRLPSALAGVAAIPALFALGRRMYSSWMGLAAALLLAVSQAPIYFSQEARTYALALLATLFTFLVWYPLFASPSGQVTAPRRWMAGYIAAATVLLYLHYYGLLIVLGQALGALWLHRSRGEARRRVLMTYGVVGILYSPWLLVSIYQYVRLHNVDWIQKPQPGFVLEYLGFAFNDSTALGWMAALAVVALGVHLVVRRRHGVEASLVREDASILAWLLFPLAAAYLVSIAGRPLLVTRYLVIVLPALYLVVARVLALLPGPRLARSLAVAVLAGAILVDLTGRLGYYTTPQKAELREAAAYVMKHDIAHTESLVITYPWPDFVYNYYFERAGSALRADVAVHIDLDLARVDAALEQRQPERIWFIHTDQPVPEELTDHLQQQWRLVSQQEYSRAGVWLYERK